MTGVELILLLIGSVFMVGSFFITEKLSPSELDKIAELSENELRRIIDRELENAGTRIEEAIDTQIEASADKVDRALEKETNEKIMAISEYSDTVLESMNKTHNEIMFLYSMLNDKHTELTGMVSDLQRLAADVRDLQENMQLTAAQPQSAQPRQGVLTPQSGIASGQPSSQISRAAAGQPSQVPRAAVRPASQVQRAGTTVGQPSQVSRAGTASGPAALERAQETQTPEEEKKETTQTAEKDNSNQAILALHKQGLTEVEIARKLGMGVGEVRLVIGLYRGE